MEKSCFICKNMPFCKHFDNLFNKINYTQFTSNASEVINTISETIGKNCTCYAEFEKEKTCKWKPKSVNAIKKIDFIFTTSCGCTTPEYNLSNIKNKQCLHCGKKIEVVE
ncbi:MAG: hypothetical protein PHS93_08135 [Candidatus Omnitrophica bacterium]|nr:hypothetical protein [Candidatus Omnitrophota bacterium]